MKIWILLIICSLFYISCATAPVVITDENENEFYDSENIYLPQGTYIRYSQRGKILNIEPKILFEFGSSKIPYNANYAFSKLIEFMNNNPNITIIVEAHTSNKGEAYPANYELSISRASAAKKYLVQNGISTDKIIEKPLGEALPEYNSQDELRRYEFVIIENDNDLQNYNDFISTLDVTKESSYKN